jgi:hypothetical protein
MIAALFAVASLFSGVSAGTTNLRLEADAAATSAQQTGMFVEYPIAELMSAGYKECYSALYSSVTNTSHLSACSSDGNAMVVVASLYGTSATTIRIGAGGLARNVFAKTAYTNTAYCYDGACWYNYPGKSFGFAPSYTVSLSPGDTYSAYDTQRVSWNLDNNLGGYRSGTSSNLNSDSTYRKLVYIKTDPLFRILTNYPMYELSKIGYTQCYNAPYSAITTKEALSKCTADPNKRVFVGAAASSSSTSFMVGAGGIAGNVFASTSSTSAAVLSNGVYWYNVNGKSFGFAPVTQIYLADADTYDINSAERISWHMNGQAGGWRAGSANSLTNDPTYRKIVYVQN